MYPKKKKPIIEPTTPAYILILDDNKAIIKKMTPPINPKVKK